MTTSTLLQLSKDVDDSWKPIFESPEIISALSTLDTKIPITDVYPLYPMIFDAFKKCPFPPKVTILSQDPYHANSNEAMGLAFSVPDGVKIPPSLRNIFKELMTDIEGFVTPDSGNLTSWAKQGVLMLNTALTVMPKKPNSHSKAWKEFTTLLLSLMCKNSNGIVFMLWGAFSRNYIKNVGSLVVDNGHHILEASHPSPLSANIGGWFGNAHFSKCNKILIENGKEPIDWRL